VISRRQWVRKREREVVGCLKNARTYSERVPEREDPQVEAKKETKARKWIIHCFSFGFPLLSIVFHYFIFTSLSYLIEIGNSFEK
jgi:hypothetical protein